MYCIHQCSATLPILTRANTSYNRVFLRWYIRKQETIVLIKHLVLNSQHGHIP